jgi:hypothetical protein
MAWRGQSFRHGLRRSNGSRRRYRPRLVGNNLWRRDSFRRGLGYASRRRRRGARWFAGKYLRRRDSLRRGLSYASWLRRRRWWWLAGNYLRLWCGLWLCNNRSRRVRCGRLRRGFVYTPVVGCRLQEFNLDIPSDSRKIAGADHSANNIATFRVGNDDGLARREIARDAQNCTIVEYNDGPGFLLGRFGWSRGCFPLVPWQASNSNCNLQTNRVGSSGMFGVGFRTSDGRTRFGQVFQRGGFLDSQLHSIAIN